MKLYHAEMEEGALQSERRIYYGGMHAGIL